MAGTIIVEADSSDTTLDVTVKMTDIEAFHDVATGNKQKVLFSINPNF